MKLYDKNKKEITINGTCLASGGEGEIYKHPSNKKLVIKVYHTARDKSFESLLKKLSILDNRFVKPLDILYTNVGKIAGFTMNFVNFNDYFLFNNLFNKAFCFKNSIDSNLKTSLLGKMKEAVEHCHNNGIVIGDLNQYNLFFSLKGDILFVDVDSYSEKGNIRTDVLLEDIRDFTTNTISELSDAYAFDVLAFWSLCFVHPYKWMVPGNTENLEVRVKSGKSILDKIPGIKIPPLYNPPSKTLEPQFIDVFKKKRRFMIELDDKVLVPAINLQLNTVVTSSSVTVVTHKDSVYDIKVFGDNLAVKTSNDHWQILKCNSKGIFIPKDIIKCDELFISDNNFCYSYNNSLYSSKGQAVRGLENTYHYFQNGQLFVLDYERDSASIYNIDSQLVNIDYNKFVIFAQSVVIRQSILQNFGAKKVTGILRNKTFCMTDIPLSTKDLIISDKYFCAEYIENKKAKTSIFEIKGTNYEKVLDTDNLVNFTNKGDILFIPNDGEIKVYNKAILLETIPLSVCTKFSSLYFTGAGIVVYENNKLYLINKK